MKRSPILRKSPLRAKEEKRAKRMPWIKPKKKIDLSRMDCCPEAKERAAALVAMGCACCGSLEPEIHHIRRGTGMSARAVWWRTIPLCLKNHTTGGPGVAVHAGEKIWRWDELEVLAWVNSRLPESLHGPSAGR